LQEFKTLIETNPRIYMYFTAMWDEVPHNAEYSRDPAGRLQVRDYHHMLQVLNHVYGSAPEWSAVIMGLVRSASADLSV